MNSNFDWQNQPAPGTTKMESAVLSVSSFKKKAAKGFLNYAGILSCVVIVFVATVALTTDITASWEGLTSLGLSFFVILFCSYSAYICCSDSGMRAGYLTETYSKTVSAYDALNEKIVSSKLQNRLFEFCRWYADGELRKVRERILVEQNITYEEYEEKYIGKGKKEIRAFSGISEQQKKAILHANGVKSLNLTPNMIMKRECRSNSRDPLGHAPEELKRMAFIRKFFTTSFISFVMSIISVQIIQTPTWEMFVSVFLKMVSVVLSGFFGYKCGYENIVISSVRYMRAQMSMMSQFMTYVEEYPAISAEREEKSEHSDPHYSHPESATV